MQSTWVLGVFVGSGEGREVSVFTCRVCVGGMVVAVGVTGAGVQAERRKRRMKKRAMRFIVFP